MRRIAEHRVPASEPWSPTMKQQRYLNSPSYREAQHSLAYKLIMGTAAVSVVMATAIAVALVG
jgi:hypothetical protein